MSSDFGHKLHVSVFGQSHGPAIGMTMDGLPAGEHIDMTQLQRFMERRRPGRNRRSSQRQEADQPIFLSGLVDDNSCGAPICAIIENHDQRSVDYTALADCPRPSHADYTAWLKWGGQADMRGGGHFSGRLTAPLCIAGGIALQVLARRNIHIGAHLAAVGEITDAPFPLYPTAQLFTQLATAEFPAVDPAQGQLMQEAILAAAAEQDSLGGVIEAAAIGFPAGLGWPMFDGVENRLAAALFGIPAVKGVEFGSGFTGAGWRGSHNNDPFILDEQGRIVTASNHSGGVQGGISNGMPLVLRLAVKPTPSIGQPQRSVSLSRREEQQLKITGRHDPCIAERAVPVAEAVTALVLLDILLEEGRIDPCK